MKNALTTSKGGVEAEAETPHAARSQNGDGTNELKIHNAIIDAASLDTLELLESRFSRPKSQGTAKSKAVFACDSELSGSEFDGQAGSCSTIVTWTLKASLPNTRTNFTLRASYRVGYGGLSSKPEHAVTPLVEHMAKFACFTYFRSHVAHVVAEAGMYLPPLPVLKGHIRKPGSRRKADAGPKTS